MGLVLLPTLVRVLINFYRGITTVIIIREAMIDRGREFIFVMAFDSLFLRNQPSLIVRHLAIDTTLSDLSNCADVEN